MPASESEVADGTKYTNYLFKKQPQVRNKYIKSQNVINLIVLMHNCMYITSTRKSN